MKYLIILAVVLVLFVVLISRSEHSAEPTTVQGAAAGAALTVATLDACLENIKMFQKRYSDEQAKAKRNQAKQQAHNNAVSTWNQQHQIQKNKLQAGHTAPSGHIWFEDKLVNCAKYK